MCGKVSVLHLARCGSQGMSVAAVVVVVVVVFVFIIITTTTTINFRIISVACFLTFREGKQAGLALYYKKFKFW
jgi:hypothetical protein